MVSINEFRSVDTQKRERVERHVNDVLKFRQDEVWVSSFNVNDVVILINWLVLLQNRDARNRRLFNVGTVWSQIVKIKAEDEPVAKAADLETENAEPEEEIVIRPDIIGYDIWAIRELFQYPPKKFHKIFVHTNHYNKEAQKAFAQGECNLVSPTMHCISRINCPSLYGTSHSR